jgi:hypothetical protein
MVPCVVQHGDLLWCRTADNPTTTYLAYACTVRSTAILSFVLEQKTETLSQILLVLIV